MEFIGLATVHQMGKGGFAPTTALNLTRGLFQPVFTGASPPVAIVDEGDGGQGYRKQLRRKRKEKCLRLAVLAIVQIEG